MPEGILRAQTWDLRQGITCPICPHLDTWLYVDHGPMGIVLILAQKHTDQARKKYVILSAELTKEALMTEGQARKKYVNSSTELTRENFSEILVLGENFCGKITVFLEPVNA